MRSVMSDASLPSYRNQTFTFGDFLANGVHLGLREYSRFLDYERRIELGRRLGRLALTRLPRFRRRVRSNLDLIYPDAHDAWKAGVAQDCASNVGQSLMEHMHMQEFAERFGNLNITGDGAADISADQPAILITGHFGQWEGIRIGWRHITQSDCGFLFRPHNNGFFDRHWQRYLGHAGRPAIPKGRAGKELMTAHLDRGGSILFANDQHQSRANYFDFMGHPARTATTAAALALQYGVPLIPVYAVRRSNLFDYDIVFEQPIAPSTPEDMIGAVNASLSARVEAHPGQYFWSHRRWR
jgi:KDO2-lipid IV(A) lauroyltransferase